jgi:hypothetical protein
MPSKIVEAVEARLIGLIGLMSFFFAFAYSVDGIITEKPSGGEFFFLKTLH